MELKKQRCNNWITLKRTLKFQLNPFSYFELPKILLEIFYNFLKEFFESKDFQSSISKSFKVTAAIHLSSDNKPTRN